MSEEATTSAVEEVTAPVVKITSEKPVKIKDPKKVAQGKKLAEISKQAKERKMREKKEAETHEGEWNVPWGYVVGTVGLSVAAGALYFGYYNKKNGFVWNAPEVRVVKRAPTKTNNLESFD